MMQFYLVSMHHIWGILKTLLQQADRLPGQFLKVLGFLFDQLPECSADTIPETARPHAAHIYCALFSYEVPPNPTTVADYQAALRIGHCTPLQTTSRTAPFHLGVLAPGALGSSHFACPDASSLPPIPRRHWSSLYGPQLQPPTVAACPEFAASLLSFHIS